MFCVTWLHMHGLTLLQLICSPMTPHAQSHYSLPPTLQELAGDSPSNKVVVVDVAGNKWTMRHVYRGEGMEGSILTSACAATMSVVFSRLIMPGCMCLQAEPAITSDPFASDQLQSFIGKVNDETRLRKLIMHVMRETHREFVCAYL